MNTIQFDLGGGAVLALPATTVAEKLLSNIKQSSPPSLTAAAKPVIGEYIPSQGGVYSGDIMGDDGVLYGLIIAAPKDVGKASWGPEDEPRMSEWYGLHNTSVLGNKPPVAKLARGYQADGHCDFYLPSLREMMVALANVSLPSLIKTAGIGRAPYVAVATLRRSVSRSGA